MRRESAAKPGSRPGQVARRRPHTTAEIVQREELGLLRESKKSRKSSHGCGSTAENGTLRASRGDLHGNHAPRLVDFSLLSDTPLCGWPLIPGRSQGASCFTRLAVWALEISWNAMSALILIVDPKPYFGNCTWYMIVDPSVASIYTRTGTSFASTSYSRQPLLSRRQACGTLDPWRCSRETQPLAFRSALSVDSFAEPSCISALCRPALRLWLTLSTHTSSGTIILRVLLVLSRGFESDEQYGPCTIWGGSHHSSGALPKHNGAHRR